MTLYHSTGIIAASGGAAAKPGMVLLKPTSVDHSGTSASIGANGQVTFTAVTSLSLNGVFSASWDNYVIAMYHSHSASANIGIDGRYRTAGTDASGSNYTNQYLYAGSTTVVAARSTTTSFTAFPTSNAQRSGGNLMIYGPALAQPTAWRGVIVTGESNATVNDWAGTHSLSTSYDGITFSVASGNFTGTIAVYGIRS